MEDFTTILIGDGAHAWFCVFFVGMSCKRVVRKPDLGLFYGSLVLRGNGRVAVK